MSYQRRPKNAHRFLSRGCSIIRKRPFEDRVKEVKYPCESYILRIGTLVECLRGDCCPVSWRTQIEGGSSGLAPAFKNRLACRLVVTPAEDGGLEA